MLNKQSYIGARLVGKMIVCAMILLLALPVCAGELTGFAAIDTRVFFSGAAFNAQRRGNGPSIVLEPEYYHVSAKTDHVITVKPFVRLDGYDGHRRHWDIRQADWLYAGDDWEFKVGISKEFWGVMETNHLVDIINQTDAVEDSDGEDKFGQPMVQFAYLKDWGTVRLYYLPYFRERSFVGQHGRLRGPIAIEGDRAVYDAKAKQWHPDIAVRYEHTIGDWDIGVAHFSGTSREALLLQAVNGNGQMVFIPRYELIDQSSIDVQLTKEAWLWKLEALSRSGQGDRFYAASAGVEYSFYDINQSGADIGLLSEYHHDDRTLDAPATLLDNDIFFGARIALNDVDDSTFLGGVMLDTETKTRFYSVEAATRLTQHWKIECDVRVFSHINNHQIEYGIAQDDHISIRLARYF